MNAKRTREVPCRDLADNADRLVPRVCELVVRRLDDFTLDLVGPAGVVLDGIDPDSQIRVHSPPERLAYSHPYPNR